MALEEKRALEEILIRPNSLTNDGKDGVSIAYRTWIEKDGVEKAGTSSVEGPFEVDWEDPEVTSRIGELPAKLQLQIDALQDDNATVQLQLTQRDERIAQLESQLADAEKQLADLRGERGKLVEEVERQREHITEPETQPGD